LPPVAVHLSEATGLVVIVVLLVVVVVGGGKGGGMVVVVLKVGVGVEGGFGIIPKSTTIFSVAVNTSVSVFVGTYPFGGIRVNMYLALA